MRLNAFWLFSIVLYFSYLSVTKLFLSFQIIRSMRFSHPAFSNFRSSCRFILVIFLAGVKSPLSTNRKAFYGSMDSVSVTGTVYMPNVYSPFPLLHNMEMYTIPIKMFKALPFGLKYYSHSNKNGVY